MCSNVTRTAIEMGKEGVTLNLKNLQHFFKSAVKTIQPLHYTLPVIKKRLLNTNTGYEKSIKWL